MNIASPVASLRHWLIVGAWCVCILTAHATGERSLISPYHAVSTHLTNLQDEQLDPSAAGLPFRAPGISRAEAELAARQWKQVLDAAGIKIDLNALPRDPQYRDTLTDAQQYVLTPRFPDVYLERQGRSWRYSTASVNRIHTLHRETFVIGTDALLNLLPERLSQRRLLGFYLWQIFGVGLLTLTSYLVFLVSRFLSKQLALRYLQQRGYGQLGQQYILPIVRPFSAAVVVLLLTLALPALQFSVEANRYLQLLLRAMLPILLSMTVYRLINLISLFFEKLAARTDSPLDDQLVPLGRKTAKAIVIIFGTLIVLRSLDVDITTLLTGVSIGGLAFALAAQDTIKNFFGSVMIFIDRPFRIGDWITSGDIDGSVEEVGFRSTRIRTFRNSVTYVPNGKLADATIDNHGLRVYRRFNTRLGLAYDTPADLVEIFVEGLKQLVLDHPKIRKDFFEIHLHEISASSYDVMFYIFFTVPTWSEELRCRHEVLLEVIRLAKRLDVRLAFPTQTLHVETVPGQPSLVPTYPDDLSFLRQRLRRSTSSPTENGGTAAHA